jgi:glutamate-1-semialdehyde 2,1-aminomutase
VSKSKALFQKAKTLMPGGVNSPVRAYKPFPFFTASAQGSRLQDVDGKKYIDYCLAYGPLILGHANPEVTSTAMEKAKTGTMYGTPSELEVDLADRSGAR